MTVVVNSDLCWAFGLISPSVLGEFPGVKYAKFQRSPDNQEKWALALCNEILRKQDLNKIYLDNFFYDSTYP